MPWRGFRVRHHGQAMKRPPSSAVSHSNALSEWKAAKSWGLTPDEWVKKPRWARAQMLAENIVTGEIEYWVAEDEVKNASGSSR